MTDALGPPEPGERFSSLLPMFGPATAAHCSARSKLKVGCDMAQAFDIPCGIRTAANERSPAGVPSKSRIPAKVDPVRVAGWKYGSVATSRQASSGARLRRVDSRPTIGVEVNQSEWIFQKIIRLHDRAAKAQCSPISAVDSDNCCPQ